MAKVQVTKWSFVEPLLVAAAFVLLILYSQKREAETTTLQENIVTHMR